MKVDPPYITRRLDYAVLVVLMISYGVVLYAPLFVEVR